MSETVAQLYYFLYSFISGSIVVLLFDLFRIKRRVFTSGKVAIFFEDLFYWILSGFVLFLSIFCLCHGITRGYIFIAIILGVMFYIAFLSKMVIKLGTILLSIFIKPFSFVACKIKKIYTKFSEERHEKK